MKLIGLTSLVLVLSSLVIAVAQSGPYVWRPVTIKANGFIDGIVYSPAAKGVVYINTDMGGAYRWDAQASRWVCMTDWAACDDPAAKHMGVETLAVDPTDADRVYFSIGTYMSPTAILRSTDGGRTRERVDVPFKSNGNGSARNTGQRMIVDPNAPNVLYYGTRVDGLWRSTDHAKSWARIESFPTIGHNEGWGRDTGILFVQVDPKSGTPGSASKVIYAGVFDPIAGRPRLFRSTDAAGTWTPLPGGQPTQQNLFPQRTALTPDGQTMYITYASSTQYPGPWGIGSGRVFKVTDPAGPKPTWTDITPAEASRYAFSAVALDPVDPTCVYVSEMGNYNPADRIWRSNDAGATWAAINPNSHRDDSSAPYARSGNVHWLGDLQIDPHDGNVAMFTTGYGLYRTTNLRDPEPKWSFFNDGFEQSAITEMASPTDGPVHLISAIGDRDGYRHDDFTQSPALGAHGQAQGLSRGTSSDIAIAARDAQVVVRTINAAPFVQYSLDNAVTWQWMPDAPAGIEQGGHVALSADGTRCVWSPRAAGRGNDAGIWISTREGKTWGAWKRAAGLGSLRSPAVVLADPEQPQAFYAYADSALYRSTDGGAQWKVQTSDAPRGIRWIRAVAGKPGALWGAGHESRLWKSDDAGKTWSQVLPERISFAYVLATGPAMPGAAHPAVYIGGVVDDVPGVFRSDDDGATWVRINDDEHHYGQLICIQADARVPGRIYLGTNGRGIVYGEPRQ